MVPIKIGATYERRDGRTTTITETTNHAVYAFRCKYGYMYDAQGRYCIGQETGLDIVKDFTEERT